MPHPVKEEQSGEVGRLEGVQRVHELGAEDGVGCGEVAAREHAQLEELGDGAVLGHL